MSMDFPQFRKLEGAPNLYVIEGPKHVTEWQPMGDSKWVVHQHYASDYPRYQWVTELLQGDDPVRALTADAWEALYKNGRKHRRTLRQAEYLGHKRVPQQKAAVGPLTFGAAAHAQCLAEVASDADVRWALEDGEVAVDGARRRFNMLMPGLGRARCA